MVQLTVYLRSAGVLCRSLGRPSLRGASPSSIGQTVTSNCRPSPADPDTRRSPANSKQQHGRKSLCTNLLECVDGWTLNSQSRHVTDAIFFDFKNVFDTVCHRKLLVKLVNFGKLLSWIEAFICVRSQSLRIGTDSFISS